MEFREDLSIEMTIFLIILLLGKPNPIDFKALDDDNVWAREEATAKLIESPGGLRESLNQSLSIRTPGLNAEVRNRIILSSKERWSGHRRQLNSALECKIMRDMVDETIRRIEIEKQNEEWINPFQISPKIGHGFPIPLD
jgi:hypothetical protein